MFENLLLIEANRRSMTFKRPFVALESAPDLIHRGPRARELTLPYAQVFPPLVVIRAPCEMVAMHLLMNVRSHTEFLRSTWEDEYGLKCSFISIVSRGRRPRTSHRRSTQRTTLIEVQTPTVIRGGGVQRRLSLSP